MTDTGTVTLLTPAQGLAEFERNAGLVVNLLADADLGARVPHCPGWTLTELVGHLGGVHTWARHAVVAGTPDGPDVGPEETDRDGLIAWYSQVAGSLADVLRNTDPDAPAWNFGPKPRTARFWFRRQAHETAIHLADAEASQGRTGSIDDGVALDGIDEVVTMFFPRQVRLGRMPPLAITLRIEAGSTSWLLAGDGTAPDASRPGGQPFVHDHGGGVVRGTAEALVLLLWNRIGLDDDRIGVTGDVADVRAVLEAGIVP